MDARKLIVLVAVAVAVTAVADLSAAGQAPGAAGQSARRTVRPAGSGVSVALRSDMNKVDPDGTTALHHAVRSGDVVRAQALIKAGADAKIANRYGVTPLALAAQSGDPAMTDLLLKAGADANTTWGEDQQTVLMAAARSGNTNVVESLLAHGASVDAKEALLGQTALMLAAGQNHADVVTLLAKGGADVNAYSVMPDRRAAGGGTAPPAGLTAMLFAARNGALETVKALIAAGARIDAGDPNGNPPLVYALLSGHYDVAAALLDAGANPNVYDSTGRGPLYVAVDMHRLEYRNNRPDPKLDDAHTSLDIAKILLERGAEVDHALVSTIIPPKNGANGHREMTAGSTSFLRAATTSDVEMMRLLVDWGANPFATNKSGTNAMILAAGLSWRPIYGRGTQEQAIEAIKFCLELGMDINAVDDNGQTALHGAAMRSEDVDSNKLIQFLVDHGANLYAKNKQGRTPLDEASGELAQGNFNPRTANPRSMELLTQLMKNHPNPLTSPSAR